MGPHNKWDCTKVVITSYVRLRNEFKLFLANIRIFEFNIPIVFAIKTLIDEPYGSLNLQIITKIQLLAGNTSLNSFSASVTLKVWVICLP